ncbi:DUF262 domain-containing protein [Occultella gossypii]|uniref:DUF262 domain-containing protein n=1 Tax=Occultella gossypii TaxID=2800820 RepID=A0ABS7SC15_9MICO|nr:DUF262 domain-containing protein [Occultella gossypii]MBZ2197911.1 DUF262 domain-containing protein [Occultella gossypii]
MPQDDFLKYEASGIAALLRTRTLAVPFYQRSYSWITKEGSTYTPDSEVDKLQVIDFWSDLTSSFANNFSYFMGTVVLAREGDGADGRQLVIDGQQRLATTSLLLAAIRDKFETGGANDFAKSTQQDYLGKFDRRVGLDQPKLILNTEDRDFYERRIVLGRSDVEPANYSQGLISEAFEYLSERVENFTASHGTAWRDKLNELVDWLDTSAQIVAIDVATEADAFLIFETLNDRGADLTVADLLKNFLFSRSASRLDEVRDNWVATLTNLDINRVGNQRFTNFARHLLSSKYGRTREREVYGRLKDIVASPASAVTFSQELKDSSRLYYAMLTADSDFWGDYPAHVSSAAEILVELNLEQYRPLLLAALSEFDHGEIVRFVPTMVSWAIRGLSSGTLGAGTAEAAFCEAARDIRSGKIKTTEQILAESRVGTLIPTDGAFEAAFAGWRVMRGSLARYLLRALELQERGDAEPELVVNDDVEAVNLEHVLPKNAKRDDWPAFTEDDQRAYVHRLGNLCLLQKGPNGRIGNKPWAAKQSILKLSSLRVTADAAANSNWTKSVIDRRQKQLATLAVSAWPRLPRG